MHKGSWQESRDLWVRRAGEETNGQRKHELQEGERGSSDSLPGMGLNAFDVSGWVSSLLSDTAKIWTKEFWEEKKGKVAGCKTSLSPQTLKHTVVLPRTQIFTKCYAAAHYHRISFFSFSFSSVEQTVTSWTREAESVLQKPSYLPTRSNLLQVSLWHFSPTKALIPLPHLQHGRYSLSVWRIPFCVSMLQKQTRQQEFCQNQNPGTKDNL